MKNIILLFLLAFCSNSVLAQDFLDGANRFSSKKESFLTLKDGSEVTGFIEDIDRKKGLIEEIELKVGEEKVKYKPEDVDFMYLMPSGFDKFARGYDNMFDMTELEKDRTVNEGLIKEGYVYFETVDVKIKKKTRTLLMQLVNPGYDSKIRVYHDPFASESASIGFGGLKVAGGHKKSYYVKKGDDVALKLKSKKYKKEWENLFAECQKIEKAFDGKMKWKKFSEHIYHFTTKCD
jgi:hypothetical protein